MRTKILYISIIAVLLLLSACKNFLDVQPLDRVSADQLFSDVSGVKTVLATMYNNLPIEDYDYNPERGGFKYFCYGCTGNGDGGWSISGHTDEVEIYSNSNPTPTPVSEGWWGYTSIRYTNLFFQTISSLKANKTLTAAQYDRLNSEGHFCRAYLYFGLAKRYGGVPIINGVQELSSDNSALYVPRSKEKATWDYILSECDSAILNLPTTVTSQDGTFRATKWAAYALKSRAALHAASLAKYWNNAPLTGIAVDQGLVGGVTDANNYYLQCINASKALIDNGGYSLYKPTPANSAEAAKNFQTIFETPSAAASEIIFKKGYIDGSTVSSNNGHNTDIWFSPTQTHIGTPYMYSRWSTTLDLVELFEDYTDNRVGASKQLVTRTDGIETEVLNYGADVNITRPYKYYTNQYDIFAGKDARLFGGIIVPGCVFKGVTINMQGGLIKSDGTKQIFQDGSAVGLDGNTYYTFGSNNSNSYSGFASMNASWASNYSCTGFALRKFIQEAKAVPGLGYASTNDWIDFRLAEIYLNYAEAAIESGQGDAALAATYLNAIRHRAAHTDNLPATLANILKERRVELFFEGQRYWDLVRRREYHTLVTGYKRKALVPILDLRQNPPKYFFVRTWILYDQMANGYTMNTRGYYQSIPGTASNNLVQNPLY